MDRKAIHVYSLTPVNSKVGQNHSVECLSTSTDLVLLGTREGKVLCHVLETTPTGVEEAILRYTLSTNIKGAARFIQPIVSKQLLLVTVGECLVVYSAAWLTPASARDFDTHEVTRVGGLRDVVSVQTRRYKNALAVLVLCARKLVVYLYKEEGTPQLVLHKTVSLNDKATSMALVTQRIVLVQVGHHTCVVIDSHTGTVLGECATAGGHVSLCDLRPAPEGLLVQDRIASRVLMDGSCVPCEALSPFDKPPSLLFYEHPFLVSLPPASSATQLEVRIPLLGDRESGVSVVQVVSHSAVLRRCSHPDSFIDFDEVTEMGHKRERNLIAVLDSASSLFLLRPHPLSLVVSELSEVNSHAAITLASLCVHQVDQRTLRAVYVKHICSEYAEKRFDGLDKVLRESGIDPLFFIRMFLSDRVTVRKEVLASEWSSLEDAIPKSSTCALTPASTPFFIQYLTYVKTTAYGEDASAEVKKLLDTALLHAHMLASGDKESAEEDLLRFLLHDVSREFLSTTAIDIVSAQLPKKWFTLASVYYHLERYEDALQLLYCIATEKAPTARENGKLFISAALQQACDALSTAEPSTVMNAADTLIHSPKKLTTTMETLLGGKGSTPLLAVVLGILYLRLLPIVSTSDDRDALFRRHQSWLLSAAPARWGVCVYTTVQKNKHYARCVALLNHLEEEESANPSRHASLRPRSKEVYVSFLLQLVAQEMIPHGERHGGGVLWSVDEQVCNDCWRRTASLLLEGDAAENSKDRWEWYRTQLGLLLSHGQLIHVEEAITFFETNARDRSFKERAILYRRVGRHAEAVLMFLDEAKDVEEAKGYALSCAKEFQDNTACVQLVQALLARDGEEGLTHVGSLLQHIHTADAALSILPSLPATTELHLVYPFLKSCFHSTVLESLEHAAQRKMDGAVEDALRTKLVGLQTKQVTIDENSICDVCKKRLRPNVSIACFPDGSVVHELCGGESHISPRTGCNFKDSLETKLL